MLEHNRSRSVEKRGLTRSRLRDAIAVASGDGLRWCQTSQRGSTLVEFGLVIILLMTMMMGVMDFARALYSYHFISNAAREGARFGAVHGSTCTQDSSCTAAAGPTNTSPITSYVSGITPPGIDTTQLTTTPTWPGNGTATCTATPNYPSCPVQVQVSYRYKFMFTIVSKGTLNLSSTSQMIIAH